MSTVRGLAEDARLNRIQEATKAYAMAWQAPSWPSTLAGALLLLAVGLHPLGAPRAGELISLYTPLAWAAAQRFAFRSWSPPLGQVRGTFGVDGTWARTERGFLSFFLAGTNLMASVRPELGLNASLASLGALAFLWMGKALPGGTGAVVILGSLDPRLRPDDTLGLAVRLFAGASLLLFAFLEPIGRRRALARIARSAAELGKADKPDEKP